jgi:hypothetical protein
VIEFSIQNFAQKNVTGFLNDILFFCDSNGAFTPMNVAIVTPDSAVRSLPLIRQSDNMNADKG